MSAKQTLYPRISPLWGEALKINGRAAGSGTWPNIMSTDMI